MLSPEKRCRVLETVLHRRDGCECTDSGPYGSCHTWDADTQEGHPLDNLLLEIKSYKFAQNREFKECMRPALEVVLDLAGADKGNVSLESNGVDSKGGGGCYIFVRAKGSPLFYQHDKKGFERKSCGRGFAHRAWRWSLPSRRS